MDLVPARGPIEVNESTVVQPTPTPETRPDAHTPVSRTNARAIVVWVRNANSVPEKVALRRLMVSPWKIHVFHEIVFYFLTIFTNERFASVGVGG